MKHVTIALMICAIPATTFAQDVSCPDCDHVAPYFRGVGGFIGTVADGVDEVIFVASCGGVTTTGEAQIAGGTVAQLFNHRNGLACDREGGSLEIAGLADGGWYWITDEMNSAVGSLVREDVLDNTPTQPTDPGSDDITLTQVKGAVFVKQASTGRVGLLSTILPAPLEDRPAICGPRYSTRTESYSSQATSNCVLGDGGTKIRLLGRGRYGGHVHLTSRRVTRDNAEGGPITVLADLWVNESGSYSTADPVTPALGWVGKGEDNWLQATWTASLAGGAPGADLAGAAAAIADSDNNGQAEITISPSATHCPATGTQYTATVDVVASTNTSTNNVHPAVDADDEGVSAMTRLRVECPPRAAANQGRE